MRWLYCSLLYLATPFALLRLLIRSRKLTAYRQRIPERFGLIVQPSSPIAVWVHAVSVGESLAAMPMIHRLIEQHGEGRVWVTTTTPTGSERVTSMLGGRVQHSYAPYDLPGSVARFLKRVRPEQVIIMETELWPNLFRQLRRAGIPILIANARLSPRSLRGYSRIAGLTREVLSDVNLVAAQSQADADRFTRLGAPRVENLGNIKFDILPPSEQREAGRQLRRLLGDSRPVWIAASTHEGEEQIASNVHRNLRKQFPGAVLIIVPRHPQRFPDIRQWLDRSGLHVLTRTSLGSSDDWSLPANSEPPDILLGDSLGEMWMYLQAADVAFVAGSLVPVGGHNVMEPAALGIPVLFGPHMHNFVPAQEMMKSCGAGIEITDERALSEAIAALLADPKMRTEMGESGQKAVLANQGALDRLMKAISKVRKA